jgi:hypothetical protein
MEPGLTRYRVGAARGVLCRLSKLKRWLLMPPFQGPALFLTMCLTGHSRRTTWVLNVVCGVADPAIALLSSGSRHEPSGAAFLFWRYK